MYNLQVSQNRTMFNFMHAKFQVAGFQNKKIYVIVFSMSSVYFYSDIYWSRGLGGFLPLTAAKFRIVWKISDQSIKTSPKICATHASYFLKLYQFSLYSWNVGRLFFNTQTNDCTRHYCDSTKDSKHLET